MDASDAMMSISITPSRGLAMTRTVAGVNPEELLFASSLLPTSLTTT